jgi:hypothetical protein
MLHNARLTEQIFDGGFYAYFCTKGDSGNFSGAAVFYKPFGSLCSEIKLNNLSMAGPPSLPAGSIEIPFWKSS